MTAPLTLLLFDRTQLKRRPLGLGLSWRAGSVLYRTLGWADRAYAADDWDSALDWIASLEPQRPIREIQYWGHGKWGRALIDRDVLDRRALEPGHRLHARLEAIRERMTRDGLVWFRTCETLGAQVGLDFAKAFTDFMGVSVGGHTYEIGYFQSGLHALAPGAGPDWSASEGLSRGSPELPERAAKSSLSAPNTITCFTSDLPAEYRQRVDVTGTSPR